MQLFVGLACLAISLLLGELVKDATGMAVPPPVLGVVILVGVFIAYGRVPDGVRLVGGFLLRHMALFFIPPLVGLLAISDVLREILLPLMVILIVSTLIPLWASAWAFQRLAAKSEPRDAD